MVYIKGICNLCNDICLEDKYHILFERSNISIINYIETGHMFKLNDKSKVICKLDAIFQGCPSYVVCYMFCLCSITHDHGLESHK